MLEAIRRHQVKRVLEIAPGPARLSAEVHGFERGCLCDVNVEMLKVATRRLAEAHASGQRAGDAGKWSPVVGDAFSLPFNEQFDMVYTFRFIRHFQQKEREQLYGQIRSCLKKGGLLVFDAVNERVAGPLRMKQDPKDYPIYDVLYRRNELLQEISDNGFSVLSLAPVMLHISTQQLLQIHLGPRSPALARWLIGALELAPGQPLEWIAVCRRK